MHLDTGAECSWWVSELAMEMVQLCNILDGHAVDQTLESWMEMVERKHANGKWGNMLWANRCGAVWFEGVLLCVGSAEQLAHGLVDGVCTQNGARGSIECTSITHAKENCSASVTCAWVLPGRLPCRDAAWVGELLDNGLSRSGRGDEQRSRVRWLRKVQ